MQTDSGTCRVWETVLVDWEPGEVIDLQIQYRLSAPIFDGEDNYATGNYLHRITANTVGDTPGLLTPTDYVASIDVVEQHFEHGRMFWLSNRNEI